MRLAAALWRYWQGKGHLEEGAATVSRSSPWRAPMHGRWRGSACSTQRAASPGGWAISGRPTGSTSSRSRDARALRDPHALALALFNRSHSLAAGQDSPDSTALREEATRLYEQIGNARGAARVRWISANLLMPVDAAAATKELEGLLRIYAELDDDFYTAMAAGSLSWSLLETGDFDRSLEYGLMSFRLGRRSDDVAAATIALRDVEVHFLLLGHVREAAILDGGFDALCSRYGISTPPAFTAQARRLWSGPEAIRDAGQRSVRSPASRRRRDDTRRAGGPDRSNIRGAREAGQPAPTNPGRVIDSPAMRSVILDARTGSTPASQARSPRTRCSRRSATSTARQSRSFRAVFEALRGRPSRCGRRRPDRERGQRHGARERRPAARARARDRRRGRRSGPAEPRRAARPGPRRDRAGLFAHPGPGPGRGVPADAAVAAPHDLQHRGRRQVHR